MTNLHNSSKLPLVVLPKTYNYIGAFLTYKCSLNCEYCINKSSKLVRVKELSSTDWITGLNRLSTRPDLPVTLSGGEPTLHPEFSSIVLGLNSSTPLDLLTNMEFDIKQFCKTIHPNKFRRKAPYANIRVSYHPTTMDAIDLLEKVRYMQCHGYSIGVWAVNHPQYITHIENVRNVALKYYNIDFRLKEFLGVYEGRLYGSYRYQGATNADKVTSCLCKTSELLIAPSGSVFKCHRDMYANEYAISHILDSDLQSKIDQYYDCAQFGSCNPCDIKSKVDRYQVSGHCAVDIKDIK